MIPTLSVPNIQIAPAVEQSVFTGQNADAALGRLPVVTVPPTVSNPKVADNRAGQTPRQPADLPVETGQGGNVVPFSLSGAGELAFESPYSTTFVAQLFGQFQVADADIGALGGESVDLPLGFVDFERLSQFDFTKYMPSFAFRPRIETPSGGQAQATPQAEAVAQPQPVPAPVAAPAAAPATQAPEAVPAPFDLSSLEPVSNDLNPLPTPQATAPAAPVAQPQPAEAAPALPAVTTSPSLFTSGVDAYGATQSRNLATAFIGARGGAEISLIL